MTVLPKQFSSRRDVANFITGTTFDSLPANVVAQAKVAIRDHLGVLLAARGDKAVAAASKMATVMGGWEEATLIGVGVKVPCNLASMVNTVMTNTLEKYSRTLLLDVAFLFLDRR